MLGLAGVGIALTAGTYATLGAGAPARVGLSVLKAARKTGRMTAQMSQYVSRTLREIVDWTALRRAVGNASITEPTMAVRAVREAVKVEKSRDLVRMVGDVGRVQSKAGTQAALDGLKIAQGPRDVARVARLADVKGSRTRAILKMFGRGALFLAASAFNLAWWILWAMLTVLGFVMALKRTCERATERYCERRRARRAPRARSLRGDDARGLNGRQTVAVYTSRMHSFRNDGVDIAYLDEGEGEPVVLVHGFASTKEVNWLHPGWVSTLTRAGRRAIALDNRGHGASAKLYDPAAYHSAVMARGRARAARSSRTSRAPTSWAIRWGRASPRSWRSRIRSACAASSSAGWASGWWMASGCRNRSPMRSKRRRSPTCAIRQGRTFRAFAEQTKSDLQGARRLHPRLAPDAVAPGLRQADRCRCWSRSAARTTSRARRRSLPRCCRRGGRSTFRAATTCWRSATGCSKRACSTSWLRGPDRIVR